MGFYATETPCLPRPEAGCDRPQETYLPPKNRVGGFSATSPTHARPFASQPVETHWENEPTPTTTASGVSFYGYRFYSPELGRWINRDPIEEEGGVNVYMFINNNGIAAVDYLGLSKVRTLCCDGVAHKVWTRGWECCGKDKIHTSRQACCDGKPYKFDPRLPLHANECCKNGKVCKYLRHFECNQQADWECFAHCVGSGQIESAIIKTLCKAAFLNPWARAACIASPTIYCGLYCDRLVCCDRTCQ